METMYYIGLDVHEKTISYCVKEGGGRIYATSYCGLCGAARSSADITQRTPLSKQRIRPLQTVLIEAARMAPPNGYKKRRNKKAMPTAQHWPWRGRWWRTWWLLIAGQKAFR
jgi:hypothetical protein